MNAKLLDLVADASNPIFLGIFLLALFAKLQHGNPRRVFLFRSTTGILITYLLSHSHQWFHLWPEYGDFVSGHMAFLLSVATSFFLLDRRSLFFSMPFVVGYGALIVCLGYHDLWDLLAAACIAVPVTLLSHHFCLRKIFGASGRAL